MSIFDKEDIKFPKGWHAEEGKDVTVYAPPGSVGASYAVRKLETEQGPKLELLTRQTDANGEVNWMPSKTPMTDFPERVIREAEFRQQRIGRSWTLDGDNGTLVHKDGTFAARTMQDGSGRLELLTRQKDPNGDLLWMPAKKPCMGSPETVFREAAKRQAFISAVRDGKALPHGYLNRDPEGNIYRDTQGNPIGIHPNKHFAVRRSAEEGKLEVLTSQFDKDAKRFNWKPADKPFIGTPEQVYSEINRREFGIQKGKEQGQTKPVEKAKGQQKAASKAKGKGQGREL